MEKLHKWDIKLLGYQSFGKDVISMRVTSGANEGNEDLCNRNF